MFVFSRETAQRGGVAVPGPLWLRGTLSPAVCWVAQLGAKDAPALILLAAGQPQVARAGSLKGASCAGRTNAVRRVAARVVAPRCSTAGEADSSSSSSSVSRRLLVGAGGLLGAAVAATGAARAEEEEEERRGEVGAAAWL